MMRALLVVFNWPIDHSFMFILGIFPPQNSLLHALALRQALLPTISNSSMDESLWRFLLVQEVISFAGFP